MNELIQGFPFTSVLSLVPLIEFWEALAEDPESVWHSTATRVLDRIDAFPELRRPIDDPSILKQHTETLSFMMGAVFPISQWDEIKGAAFLPFKPVDFFATPGYRRLQLNMSPIYKERVERGEELFLDAKTMIAYHHILDRVYGIATEYDFPMLLPVIDPDTGLMRYYKITFDSRFIEVVVRGERPTLTEADLKHLRAEFNNLELWQRVLPPDRFEFRGFTVIDGFEVTDHAVLSMLKDHLLQRDALTSVLHIQNLQERLREYLHRADLELGVISFTYAEDGDIEHAHSIGRSLLLNTNAPPECAQKDNSVYFRAVRIKESILIDDLTACEFCTGYEGHLVAQGWRNLLIAPLMDGGQLIGLLELASPNSNDLDALNVIKLRNVLPLFATALRRTMDELRDRIEAVIKEHYTAIHPVVEWKFRRAANAYMLQEGAADSPKLDAIVFENVHPLYGLSDIRNSSVERNKAIWEDLLEQLGLALKVIIEASRVRPLPILDELGYRLHKQVEGITEGLNTEHEIGILDFLQHDVEGLFAQLGHYGPTVAGRIEEYRSALDPRLGILYKERKAYENSVAVINETIGRHLDAKQEYAQSMFPHYFEKYKTDGVDYNIYIGSSLVESRSFDPLYLRNLRLWQFMTMCELVWALDRERPSLEVPLDVTHLILVQHTPLTIRFRMEEKKFDVDGAYNIRYEIVKKRIDKARIKATGERLTQPGKIAIVYSHVREIQEYRSYIDYLQAVGYLTNQVEDVELEDLQGMFGLRALRVAVAPEPPESEIEIQPEQVLEAMPELASEVV